MITRKRDKDGRRGYLTPRQPNEIKHLRLSIDPAEPWSQKRLAEWIKLHPVPDSKISTRRSVEACEQGYRLASVEPLEDYLRKLIKQNKEK